jgi:hypothetical protein
MTKALTASGGTDVARTLGSKTQPVQPQFETLNNLPKTVAELFESLALTVSASVQQHSSGRPPKKQEYALPWKGFTSWHDARIRLEHFEKHYHGQLQWVPFNDSETNDGPMSLNAYPGRAFIERVTNEGDAVLEWKASLELGELPRSPKEAAERWFGLSPDALSSRMTSEQSRSLAQSTVTVRAFVGSASDPKDSIFDARDFGIGLSSEEMPSTILSLNRGNKKSKRYLMGKHGQGASSTYQYSDLTLIVSRKVGAAVVGFTLVEATWDNAGDAKTPTYRYLLVDGKIPEVEIAEDIFPAGTLVRHIGYHAVDLFHTFGENSLYGLLMRALAQPLFPVWFEGYSLQRGTAEGYPIFPGYRRFGRTIRGTVNALERAYSSGISGDPSEGDEDFDPTDPTGSESENRKLLHRASEYYELGMWNYGGRIGMGPLGRVKIKYWVADPAGRTAQKALKNWIDPNKTILMTLDGQTHAEETRSIITGQSGAKLWAVGKYMVVQIDCDELDPKAKYEMFTSTREHAKETPIKRMILDELVRRLSYDERLQELNVQLAAADVKQTRDDGEAISSLIKTYLKAAGINFDHLTRKVEKWTNEFQEKSGSKRKSELPPITPEEPPTMIRWMFTGESVKLSPGQKYSPVFETNAPPAYWNPEDQNRSKIKVLGHGVTYVGAGEMKGGRVRCHFVCPEDAVIGSKGTFLQVQLEFDHGMDLTRRLPIEIVAKAPTKKVVTPTNDDKAPEGNDGSDGKTIRVKIRKKDFTEVDIPVVTPVPVIRTDTLWQNLGWPLDAQKVGFSIRSVGGKIQLYYNAEFPPFLDLRNRMSKKSLEDEFVRRYQMKLIIHAIFTLNYDFLDEEEFTEEQKKRLRDLLCATAESLALATKSELEIESKLKSEDPIESIAQQELVGAGTS